MFLALVLTVLAGSVVWARLTPGPLFQVATNGHVPIQITAATEDVSSGGTVVHVSVTVKNSGSEAASGRVWWQLGSPGRSDTWKRRVYNSALQTVDLGPHQEAHLEWTETPAVPAGRYDIAVWAHERRNLTFHPSDGRFAIPRVVEIAPSPLLLLRHGPPRADVSISAVKPVVDGTAPAAASHDLIIDNPTGETKTARLQWEIVRSTPTPLAYWWREPLGTLGGQQQIKIAPGSDNVVRLGGPREPGDGAYAVRVWLELDGHGPGWPSADEWPDDDVLYLPGSVEASQP